IKGSLGNWDMLLILSVVWHLDTCSVLGILSKPQAGCRLSRSMRNGESGRASTISVIYTDVLFRHSRDKAHRHHVKIRVCICRGVRIYLLERAYSVEQRLSPEEAPDFFYLTLIQIR